MRVWFVVVLLLLLLATVAEGDQTRLLTGKSSKGSGSGGRESKGGGGGGGRGRLRNRRKGDCGESKPPHKHGYDDLGIRFNKFEMTDDYKGRPVYLTWNDYPMSDELAYNLSHYSTTESLVTPHDYEAKGVCIEHYIHAVGGYPTFPSKNPNSSFWDELQEVVVAQELRLQDRIPGVFVLPELWQGWTAEEVAESVHDEVRSIASHEVFPKDLLTNLTSPIIIVSRH